MENDEEQLGRESEISLSESWVGVSEALYGPAFVNELAELMAQNHVRSVLECGCGGGHILRALGERWFTGLGIDSEQKMIEMADKSNQNPSVEFKNLSWLDLDQVPESFDMVMCRGNSLTSVTGWESGELKLERQKVLALIAKSLQKMFSRLKNGGLLYIDTIPTEEVEHGTRHIEINTNNVQLTGQRRFDVNSRTVTTSGEGTVGGKYFKGETTRFLVYPEELIRLIKELRPSELWSPKLENEKNYQVICAKKGD